jgi:ketosteroid isomerase-like protein
MQASAGVREAILEYYRCATEPDVEGFGKLLTAGETALVIGTGPGERSVGRDRWLAAFEQLVGALPELRIEPGEAQGWEEGPVGWAYDTPTWVLPEGGEMKTRMTAVLRREDGGWRLVHAHFSVGVPDEEVVGLQARWGA